MVYLQMDESHKADVEFRYIYIYIFGRDETNSVILMQFRMAHCEMALRFFVLEPII